MNKVLSFVVYSMGLVTCTRVVITASDADTRCMAAAMSVTLVLIWDLRVILDMAKGSER